jgi:hypothetical protein
LANKGILLFSESFVLITIFSPALQTSDGSSKQDDKSDFGIGMPYAVDVSVELRDLIFALEGTEEIGNWTCRRTGNCIPREVKFWQAAVRNLHLQGRHSGRTTLNSAEKASQKTEHLFECFTVQHTDNCHMYT